MDRKGRDQERSCCPSKERGGVEGGQRSEQELDNAEEHLTVKITVRVRSSPVKYELVHQFSRQKGVFDVALDTKTAPALQNWNIKSVPGKGNIVSSSGLLHL